MMAIFHTRFSVCLKNIVQYLMHYMMVLTLQRELSRENSSRTNRAATWTPESLHSYISSIFYPLQKGYEENNLVSDSTTEQQMYIFISLTHTSLSMCNTGKRPENRLQPRQQKSSKVDFTADSYDLLPIKMQSFGQLRFLYTKTSFLQHILLPRGGQ